MHTKGPWQVTERDSCGDNIFAGPRRIANTYGSDSDPESKANAFLIAAATELFDLAKAYNEWEADIILNGDWGTDGMDPYPRLTESQYDRMLELQAMRNAAIHKAKGGA